MTVARSAPLLASFYFFVACSSSDSPAPRGSNGTEVDSGVPAAPITPHPQPPGTETIDAAAPAPPEAGPSFTIGPESLRIEDPAAPAGQSSSYTAQHDATTLVDGKPTVRLASTDGAANTTWAATTATHAVTDAIVGRRYRMRAKIKTEDATAAFLWWRLDGPGFFDLDNMGNPVDRRIKGTQNWQEVSLVLDVPAGTKTFAFGSGLVGQGKVWVGAFAFDEVGTDVPTTPHYSYEK